MAFTCMLKSNIPHHKDAVLVLLQVNKRKTHQQTLLQPSLEHRDARSELILSQCWHALAVWMQGRELSFLFK